MTRNLKVRLIRKRRRPKGSNRAGLFAGMAAGIATGTVAALIVGLVLTVAAAFGSVVAAYAYIARDLPDPGAIEQVEDQFKTVRIYDRTGQVLLYEVADPRGDRTYVPLDQIPIYLRQATIAMEDRNFYANPGIDLVGIGRAFLANLRGDTIQGGSTLTVQLVKNVLIPPDERYQISYVRKIKEAILALEISRRYPGREGKDRILEWYLNSNYFGNHAYGVEAAANVYFGKHVQELTLAEACMIVPIPQSPGLNPIDNPAIAKTRQELVIDTLVRQGYISPEDGYAAKQEPMVIRQSAERYSMVAPHFAIYVRDMLEREYGEAMYRRGLRVYTTLDMNIQTMAENAARTRIAEYGNARNANNAAVVVIRPQTGEILAMVGSIDYYNAEIDGQVNMATSPRQPGSSFKPYVYLAALEQGYPASTVLLDIPVTYPDLPNEPWSPTNFDMEFHGPVTIRSALACSYNVPAVRMMEMVGAPHVIQVARRLGLSTFTNDYYGLSTSLGASEVRMVDHVYGFSVLANNGVMAGQPVPAWEQRPGFRQLDPAAILLVEDSNGNILKQYSQPTTQQVADPRYVYILQSILSDPAARAPAFGTSGNNLILPDRPVASKTGTTNDNVDGWTVGFTPQYAVGVWIGNADHSKMDSVVGSTGAGPIYHDIMLALHEGLPVQPFVQPQGVVSAQICNLSGQLATEHCPHAQNEVFIEGTQPTTYCTAHQVFRINTQTGMLATVDTPPQLVEERVYAIYPPEAADWVRSNDIPQPPTEYDLLPGHATTDQEAAITSPSAYAYLSGVVEVRGNARIPDQAIFRVRYGEGLNPSAWMTVGSEHSHQVDNGTLENWDTAGLDGLYTLQLSVVDHAGAERLANVQVTVDNQPPTATLVSPVANSTFSLQREGASLTFMVEAIDNLRLEHVEFFVDGTSLGSSTVAPYTFSALLRDIGTGGHEVWAVAYDGAGNPAETARIPITVTN